MTQFVKLEDVLNAVRTNPGRFAGCTEESVREMVAGWVQDLPAIELAPLVWEESMVFSGPARAWCCVMRKHVWADRPEDRPKREKKRADLIMSAFRQVKK